jgi:predicted ester cyclase
MKTITFLAVIVLMATLYSCNTGTSATSASNATLDSIKYFDEQSYKDFVSGNFSMFERMVSPDIVDHGLGEKDVVGRDSVEAGLKEMTSQIKDLKFDIVSESADSTYSMILVRITGTSNSAKTGFPVGASIDMKNVDVLKWKDGKVTEHWGYVDPRDMMKMMASMTPPPAPKADSAMHK